MDKLLTNQAKQRLLNDKEMHSRVNKVIENISNIKDDTFDIKCISVGNDPENPEWKPIEIHLDIKIKDFHERLQKKHDIIDKAYKDLSYLDIKDIFLLGAIR